MVQLTILIPAYNAEQYLRKCLSSMTGIDSRLEVIVVNDGSTDHTEEIAREFAEKYPEQVRIISKENGGHGSTINAAIKIAQGRYFKVVDADDWIISEELTPLLNRLESIAADVVLTGFHTVDMTTGKKTAFSAECQYANREIGMKELWEVHGQIARCCNIHGVMYRTDFYRSTDVVLPEKVFYEDQEYVALPFLSVSSIYIIPIFFYQYLIGNVNQSMSFQNCVKRIGHHETVLKEMIRYRKDHESVAHSNREYYLWRLNLGVTSYFSIALTKDENRKVGEENARRMYAYLSTEAPDVLERINKKYRTLRFLHTLHVPVGVYEKFLESKLYQNVHKIWMR